MTTSLSLQNKTIEAQDAPRQQHTIFGHDVLVTIALYLDSIEACRLLRLCQSCHLQLEDMNCPSWCEAGKHDRHGLWLHGNVGWQLIGSYVHELRSVTLLDDFQLSGREDVCTLMSAFREENAWRQHREIKALVSPDWFLAQFKFDPSKVSRLLTTGDGGLPVRSEAKEFVREGCTFQVALLLSPCGEGKFRLKWQAVFIESSAYLLKDTWSKLQVFGRIIAPLIGEQQVPSILPKSSHCDQPARSYALSMCTSLAEFVPDSPVCNVLKQGHRLPCILQMSMCSLSDPTHEL
mmetsp:Transcript_12271/g.23087  ORF Transcript_12271/g.23087 Transcript_12271/m.23087 type:complete len:292 (-) Transcript_12271:8-883(-)